jgi:hypothetical protein
MKTNAPLGRASRRFLDQAADKFVILSTGHSTTGLDVIVEITGNNVKMTRPIEDLVFYERTRSARR